MRMQQGINKKTQIYLSGGWIELGACRFTDPCWPDSEVMYGHFRRSPVEMRRCGTGRTQHVSVRGISKNSSNRGAGSW